MIDALMSLRLAFTRLLSRIDTPLLLALVAVMIVSLLVQASAGEDAVRAYFAASRTPFPDQGNEIIAIAHAGETVLVEFWLTGTHLGPLKEGKQTIEPTGRAFKVRMAATFEFKPGSDKIVCERPYFDQGMVLRAIGLA